MQPADVYFIGGFGVMGWVAADEYARSQPDPLAADAAGILRHMNADHGEALVLLARAAGETGVEAATMTAVDRLGFHLRLRTASGCTARGSLFRGKSAIAGRYVRYWWKWCGRPGAR
jgi:heme iron utilization protein